MRQLLSLTVAALLSLTAIQAKTPGGVNNQDITWIAWLQPENYNHGAAVWSNPYAAGNFTQPSSWTTKTAPALNTVDYNYHPAVQFRPTAYSSAPHRLMSDNMIGITTSDAFTVFMVYNRISRSSWDYGNVVSFGPNDSYTDSYQIYYNNDDGDDIISESWTTNRRDLGEVPLNVPALLTVDNNNTGANGIKWYLNGTYKSSATSQNGSANTANGNAYKIVLGGSHYTLTTVGARSFIGDIQELIILKRNRTSLPFLETSFESDFKKIHSYLAIKYGFTLPTDYIASDGTVVFSQTLAGAYNKNIIGIGRDEESGLNQVQSKSASTDTGADLLTVYKTSTLGTQNNNSSGALTGKTFLMLGSNGLTGNTDHLVNVGTVFANGVTLSDDINFISNTVYRAQITTQGVANTGSQTVNFHVGSSTARYIFVSSSVNFPNASTRIYPVSSQIVKNVLINDGDYVAVAGYQWLPGGAKNLNFAFWLDGESYNKDKARWNNKIGGTAIGDFTQKSNWSKKTAPHKKAAGANYHPAVTFSPSVYNEALNRLQSDGGINIGTSDAFTFILVYKATDTNWEYKNILNFAGGTNYNINTTGAIGYNLNNSSSNTLHIGWNGTARELGAVPFGSTQIVTIDNSNGQTTTNGIRSYLNGSSLSTATSASQSVNNQIVLGGSYYDLNGDGERSFTGDIQEIIMLKRPKATQQWLIDINAGNDLKKIHTYLAIKYGVSMNASDYMATDGTIVWSNSANNGYNNNIFGIARDDDTGLYQKQAVSATNNRLKIYLGASLKETNHENTETMPDKTFLLIGNNGSTSTTPTTIANGTQYQNGTISVANGINFMSDAIYKAQLTGASSMTVRVQTGNTYSYVLLSTGPSFANYSTRIYPVDADGNTEIPFEGAYCYFRFVGYSAGPGGVGGSTLKLWLRADDDNMLTLENLNVGDSKIADVPSEAGYEDVLNYATSVEAVASWNDYMRDLTYSYYTSTASSQRMPIFKRTSPEMNFHPAIRMWNNGTSYGSWLRCNDAVMSVKRPDKFTVIALTNNNFTTNAWVYPISWNASISPQTYYGPQFGVVKVTNSDGTVDGGRGRVRYSNSGTAYGSNADAGTIYGSKKLFDIGSTVISAYLMNSTVSRMTLRFNDESDVLTYSGMGSSWTGGNGDMTTFSIISGGYDENRIINGVIAEVIVYEEELSDDDLNQVTSYLALKYGITLRPNTGTGRYNYRIKDGAVSAWDGTQTSGKFVTFYNNISAVVHDDASLLNNRTSHSTNSGSILHLGVAGTTLGGDNSDLGELLDGEAILSGHNGAVGVTSIANNACGDFENVFNRKWLVHKVSNRSVRLLVGAENNIGNNLGRDATDGEKNYYNLLGGSDGPLNDFYMLVATSPENLDAEIYSDVVPMMYINHEHQCNYVFTDEDTYITFAYKPNPTDCAGETEFSGVKVFRWTQWIPSTNRVSNPTLLTKGEMDLGDDISVLASYVKFEGGARTYALFPRHATTPRDGLEVMRRQGATGDASKITTSVKFNTAVIPDFYISGLDAWYRMYDEVTVTGYCKGVALYPRMVSHAGNPKNASFTITNQNRATVNRYTLLAASNANGRVNIEFEHGVDSLAIVYTVKNRVEGTNRIYISPINLRTVPPPPPVNEDGLSFVKSVRSEYITTCEENEYMFYIHNTRCDTVTLDFEDVLPANLKWKDASVGIDTFNVWHNSLLTENNYADANTLQISNLKIPPSSEVKLTAMVTFDEDASGGIYENRASITYGRIVQSVPEQHTLMSVDRFTLDDFTIFEAERQERPVPIEMTAFNNPDKYRVNTEIDITLTIHNESDIVTDMYASVMWNAGFTYKPNSLKINGGEAIDSKIYLIDLSDGDIASMFMLAGDASGESGFMLLEGITTISFTLIGPDNNGLEYVLDSNGQPTSQKQSLEVNYEISSAMDDPCIECLLQNLEGILEIPYGGKTHIIVNQHISVRKRG
jgi:hypothetical protein